MSSSISSSEARLGVGRLLRLAAVFGLLLLGLATALWIWGPPVTPVDYLAAVGAKQHRLHALPSPKVVLVGGSNLAFGMDSEALERGLCRPVVNMGIHAGLGFRYMVEELRGTLGPGDLVLVALEPSNMARPEKQGDVHYQLVDRQPAALRLMPWQDRHRLLFGVAVLRAQAAWRKATGRWGRDGGHPLYRADGFNERGDMLAHLALARPDTLQPDGLDDAAPPVGPGFLPIARDLMAMADASGATVLFTWPGQAATGFDAPRAMAIAEAFEAADLPLVGRAMDHVFPDSAFHDTRYHLRAWGRAERTARTLRDLCAHAPEQCCVE